MNTLGQSIKPPLPAGMMPSATLRPRPSPPCACAWTRQISQMVDLWPRKVARFAQSNVSVMHPLEGNPDAVGPLVAPQEAGGGSKILDDACEAYESIAWALAELRAYLPTIPDPTPMTVSATGSGSVSPTPSQSAASDCLLYTSPSPRD